MWLYFSAAVLLLGAEFSAARGRLHDPRGAWGFLEETPPGSRAKLASVLAASTIVARHDTKRADRPAAAPAPSPVPIGNGSAAATAMPAALAAAVAADKSTLSETPLGAIGRASAHGGTFGRLKSGLQIRRSVVRMEDSAAYAATLTLVHAGRTVAAADRYVKRHPWGSVLFVASAALAMTAAGRRRHPNAAAPGEGATKGRSKAKK